MSANPRGFGREYNRPDRTHVATGPKGRHQGLLQLFSTEQWLASAVTAWLKLDPACREIEAFSIGILPLSIGTSKAHNH